jgi:hypothetical protein
VKEHSAPLERMFNFSLGYKHFAPLERRSNSRLEILSTQQGDKASKELKEECGRLP